MGTVATKTPLLMHYLDDKLIKKSLKLEITCLVQQLKISRVLNMNLHLEL